MLTKPSFWGIARYHIGLRKSWNDLFRGWRTFAFWIGIVVAFARPWVSTVALIVALPIYFTMFVLTWPVYRVARWRFERMSPPERIELAKRFIRQA